MAKEQLSPALSQRMEQEKKTHTYTDFSFHDEAALRRFDTGKPDTVLWSVSATMMPRRLDSATISVGV